MSENIHTSLLVGSIVAVFGLIIFFILRIKENKYYAPKWLQGREPFLQDYRDGWFRWIVPLWRAPESAILDTYGGLDAVIYLRFLRYSIIFFSVLTFFGISIILPINYTGDQLLVEYNEWEKNFTLSNNGTFNETAPPDDSANNVTFPDKLSKMAMANVRRGSDRLFVHLVSVYVFTLLSWYYLYKSYASYVELSNSKRKKDTIQTRTVMVRNIPDFYNSPDHFAAFFGDYYGKRVSRAYLLPSYRKLHVLKVDRDKMAGKYRIAKDYQIEHDGKKKLSVIKITGRLHFLEGVPLLGDIPFLGEKRDAMEYYKKKVEKLDRKIHEEREAQHKFSSFGFVTFTTTASAMQCAQTLHCVNPNTMIVRAAPDAADLIWGHMNNKRSERGARKVLLYFCLVALFLFWSIPVIAISGLSNLENLGQIKGLGPLVTFIEKYPTLEEFLDGFLPSLALLIFMALLPKILEAILRFRAWRVWREYWCEVMRVYFVFLLLNVFLVSTIAGSLFRVAEQLVLDLSSVVELLASSLPKQSTFFMNYIITQTFISYPIFFLLRIPDYLICKILQWFVCKTKAEKEEAYKPDPPMEYHIHYAREILIFCITLTYSTMAPLILPFGVLFFVFAYWSAKYNFLFVYRHPYEGVRMTHIVVNCQFAGIMVYLLTMIGAFTANLFTEGVIPTIVLLFLTIVFRIYLGNRFYKPSKYLPLESAPRPYGSNPSRITDLMDMLSYVHPGLHPLKPLDGEIEKDPEAQVLEKDEISVILEKTNSSLRHIKLKHTNELPPVDHQPNNSE